MLNILYLTKAFDTVNDGDGCPNMIFSMTPGDYLRRQLKISHIIASIALSLKVFNLVKMKHLAVFHSAFLKIFRQQLFN